MAGGHFERPRFPPLNPSRQAVEAPSDYKSSLCFGLSLCWRRSELLALSHCTQYHLPIWTEAPRASRYQERKHPRMPHGLQLGYPWATGDCTSPAASFSFLPQHRQISKSPRLMALFAPDWQIWGWPGGTSFCRVWQPRLSLLAFFGFLRVLQCSLKAQWPNAQDRCHNDNDRGLRRDTDSHGAGAQTLRTAVKEPWPMGKSCLDSAPPPPPGWDSHQRGFSGLPLVFGGYFRAPESQLDT